MTGQSQGKFLLLLKFPSALVEQVDNTVWRLHVENLDLKSPHLFNQNTCTIQKQTELKLITVLYKPTDVHVR